MAKQILENGKYNVITCTDCGCKYTFEKVDIRATGAVSCPQCEATNFPTIKK